MGSTTTLLIPAQHPAFDGHFPGTPLLPGVVLLDEILRLLHGEMSTKDPSRGGEPELAADGRVWTISSAKFLHPVRPGETLTLEHEPPQTNGAVRFVIRGAGDGHVVANGMLVPRLAASSNGPAHGHEAG